MSHLPTLSLFALGAMTSNSDNSAIDLDHVPFRPSILVSLCWGCFTLGSSCTWPSAGVFWYCHGDNIGYHHCGGVGAEKYECVAVASARSPTRPAARLVESVGIGGLQMRLRRQRELFRNAFLATLIEQNINTQCETHLPYEKSRLGFHAFTQRNDFTHDTTHRAYWILQFFWSFMLLFLNFNFHLELLVAGMTGKSCLSIYA